MSENGNGPNPKFEGESVRIGDGTFVVPSLSIKQARKMWPTILELDKGITPENLPEKYGMMIELIHAALSRNYPDISIEDLEEMIDMGNVRRLVRIISAQSGLNRPGAQPVAPAVKSIGETSTDQSSREPAGASST